MTTFFSSLMHSPLRLVFAIILLNAVFLVAGHRVGLDRNTWPSWIQGIGSVEAILVAVWVTWHQAEGQRLAAIARAKEELDGVLSCIKSEILALQEHINADIGPLLQAHKKGKPFSYVYPLDADPFPVYRGLIPQIGAIEANLRNRIVRTYGLAQSFVSTFRHHNKLVEQLRMAQEENRVHSTLPGRDRVAALEKHLAAYSDALKRIFVDTMRASAELVADLQPA